MATRRANTDEAALSRLEVWLGHTEESLKELVHKVEEKAKEHPQKFQGPGTWAPAAAPASPPQPKVTVAERLRILGDKTDGLHNLINELCTDMVAVQIRLGTVEAALGDL